jgi:hypothetical protein
LGCRTPSHARQSKSLEAQMALILPYYNFVRPHMALKFSELIKTPAMQAGLAVKMISFREIFTTFFYLLPIGQNIAYWILADLAKALWKNDFIPTRCILGKSFVSLMACVKYGLPTATFRASKAYMPKIPSLIRINPRMSLQESIIPSAM